MPKALLTGWTGFVGAHAGAALVARGWSVRALSRRPPRTDRRPTEEIRIVPGDLSSATDLAAAAKGCDAIVHVAGLVNALDLESYREVNVRATQRLVRAARESAPDALFVLVSSQAAAGPSPDGRPVAETDPARPVSWYGISKLEGERVVTQEWPGPWIVLRPSIIYGPGDRGLLVLFRAAARGLVPVPAARSRVQLIAAERAAEAIARAAGDRSLAGRTGFLADPRPIAIGELANLLADLPDPPARRFPIPSPLVRVAGWIESGRQAITRRSRAFNADKARELLAGDWLCDGAPMERDLALSPPISLSEGLRRTWEWYLLEGWLRL